MLSTVALWGNGRGQRITPTVRAVAEALPSVVNLGTEKIVSEGQERAMEAWEKMFGFSPGTAGTRKDYSLGSGSLIDPAGFIVTSAHVVHRATLIIATFYDGTRCAAKKVASDELNDIALLKLSELPPAGLPRPIRMAEPGDVILGETVITVGNPFGLGSSISQGVLSAVGRKVVYQGKVIFNDMLQTDAAVYPGNSGGPLININAEMIGVSAAIHREAESISFAIPLQRVSNILARWLVPERFSDVSLGVIPGNERTHDGKLRIYVAEVIPDSPAWNAGLRAGTDIVACNGTTLRDVMELSLKLWSVTPGEKLRLTLGDGRQMAIKAEPITLNDGRLIARMRLGLGVRELTPELAAALGYPFSEGVLVTSPDVSPDNVKRGDLLVQIGDSVIHSLEDLARALRERHYGDSIPLGFVTVSKRGDKFELSRKMVMLKLR